jgi:hypothetical protein
VFLNHLMEEIAMTGSRPGMAPKKTSPGGKALKFYAALRLEYQQVRNVRGAVVDSLTGQSVQRSLATHVKVRAVKNKVAPPFGECEVRVRYGLGFDEFWSALQVLSAHGVVKVSSGYHYFADEALIVDDMDTTTTGRRFVRGEAAVLEFADSHPEWRARTIGAARLLVTSGAAVTGGVSADPTTSLTAGDDDLLSEED